MSHVDFGRALRRGAGREARRQPDVDEAELRGPIREALKRLDGEVEPDTPLCDGDELYVSRLIMPDGSYVHDVVEVGLVDGANKQRSSIIDFKVDEMAGL